MKKPADREKALVYLAEAALLMQRGGYKAETEDIKDVLRKLTQETLSVKASA